MTKILLCSCESQYQDARYGPRRRVHNQTQQDAAPSDREWRCTVCGNVTKGPTQPRKETPDATS